MMLIGVAGFLCWQAKYGSRGLVVTAVAVGTLALCIPLLLLSQALKERGGKLEAFTVLIALLLNAMFLGVFLWAINYLNPK